MRPSLPRPKSSSVLQLRAAQMRSAPTVSEARLWSRLNTRQLGVSFRRQFPVGNYIADFAAPAVRLIVEVDGPSHCGRARHDARRDRKLARLGYRVVRIDAKLVMQDLDAAVALVREALAARKWPLSSPAPALFTRARALHPRPFSLSSLLRSL